MMNHVNLHRIFALTGLKAKIGILLVFVVIGQYTNAEQILSSYTGVVGAGNYSYFSLHEKGKITLILESKVGDADLYVSENIEKPSYTEYDLQSATCGLDIVTVPVTFMRPVHIAIFGHVHVVETKYKIAAILDYGGIYQSEEVTTYFTHEDGTSSSSEDDESNSFKSVLWSLIVGILKIILEVMF